MSNHLAEALRLLAVLCQRRRPLSVRVEEGGHVAELVIRSASADKAAARPGPAVSGRVGDALGIVSGEILERGGLNGRLFSPIEETLLAKMTHDWQTANQLAEATQMKCNQWWYSILSNLSERGWIESGRAGYHLPPRDQP